MAVASLALPLGRFARWLFIPLLLWLIAGLAIEIFAKIIFGMTNADIGNLGNEWLMVLLNSSWNEFREFIAVYWGWKMLIFLLSLIIGTGSIVFAVIKLPIAPPSRLALIVTAALWGAQAAASRISPVDADEFARLLFAGSIVGWDIADYEQLSQVGARRPEASAFAIADDAASIPFGMLIIGESATAARWNALGYSRPTTPKINSLRDRGELKVVKGVKTDSSYTTVAVSRIMTDGTYALPSVLSAVGVRSELLSGQNHWGLVDGVDVLLFANCERKTFLSDFATDTAYFDGDLIPLFAEHFQASDAAGFCFVHLLGSHFEYDHRYPKTFRPNGLDDAYDISIAYTDSVLDDLIAQVRRRFPLAFVLYISDHGETPDKTPRSQSAELYSIPLCIWFSDAYRQKFPERVEKADNLHNCRADAVFGLILELMGIAAR